MQVVVVVPEHPHDSLRAGKARVRADVDEPGAGGHEDAGSGRSSIVAGAERLLQVEGHLEELVFSPGGGWLLSGWPEADQLLFLRLPGVSRIVAVSDVRREFDPGNVGATTFPRVIAWCC